MLNWVPKLLQFFETSKCFANYLTDSYHFQGLKGLTSCYFMRILRLFENSLYLCTQNRYIKIMTQILVTLNEDATTLHVRKAIELLRGVVSTTVFKTKEESNKKTIRQQAYVKESLERAFDEMKQARREGRKLQSADDFIKELEAEEVV